MAYAERSNDVVAAARDLVQNARSHDGPCQDPVLVADNGCDYCREAFERRWVRLSTTVMAVEEAGNG